MVRLVASARGPGTQWPMARRALWALYASRPGHASVIGIQALAAPTWAAPTLAAAINRGLPLVWWNPLLALGLGHRLGLAGRLGLGRCLGSVLGLGSSLGLGLRFGFCHSSSSTPARSSAWNLASP